MDTHAIKWDLALCLLFAWIFVFFCTIGGVKSVGKVTISASSNFDNLSSLYNHNRDTRYLPYGITRYYLPPDTSELAPPNSSQTDGIRFTYPGGMEG